MILQSAISGFYGEMEHLPNTTNKIVNLITSEILQSQYINLNSDDSCASDSIINLKYKEHN
jgi:hypothetical protein